MALLRLSNPVRAYSWGDTSTISQLLGVEDDGEPKAELWLGSHADSPSRLPDGTRLDDLIASEPQRTIGSRVEESFGARLPFLLKVLAAAAPLSLQVHPDARQAAAGFAEEEREGVPQGAAHRRYRDPFHKPEMVVALGPFDALCGLRAPAETLALLDELHVEHPAWPHLRQLLAGPIEHDALRDTVAWLLGDDERLPSLVREVGRVAASGGDRLELATAAALSDAYPGDPGVLVSLLLNRVRLSTGDALFLPAGNIHAYLHGTAIEVMAASDNVLRAGLTPKHVDVAELLRIADFTPRPVPVVVPERRGPVALYRPGAAEFELAQVRLSADEGETWHGLPVEGPRILLVLDGELEVAVADGAATERAGRGASFFVPADSGTLAVRGAGVAVVAGVPG